MKLHAFSPLFSFALVLLAMGHSSRSAQAQTSVRAHVGRFSLLTEKTGWAATNDRIYGTTDAGETWKDITPSDPHLLHGGTFSSIFFIDSSHGWTLLSYSSGPELDEQSFDISMTSDGGVTWSTLPVPAKLADPTDVDGTSDISFFDSLHGWMNLGRRSSAAFRLGELLETSDGGRTWESVKGDPALAGPILLLPDGNGFVVAYDDHALYVTHDRGSTFQEISLPPPNEIASSTDTKLTSTYDLPVFRDSQRGYEAVSFTGPDGTKPAAVLFTTEDGGATWKVDCVLKGLAPGAFGQRIVSTIAESTWTIPVAPPGSMPRLFKIPSGSSVLAQADMRKLGDAESSFISSTQGWVNTSEGLFSTTDGGQTWKDITPRAPGRVAHI